MTMNTADITTNDDTTITIDDTDLFGDMTPEEEDALNQLLASLLGIDPDLIADAASYDGPDPFVLEYPTDLTTGKVVANEERVLIVLGQSDGTELVWDLRQNDDGKLEAIRADKAPAKVVKDFVAPTTRTWDDVKEVSTMFDNEVISFVVETNDGTIHSLGFHVTKGGELLTGLDYTRNTDGTTTSNI